MANDGPAWVFCEFGLLVTGKGKGEFLPRLFRELEASGRCGFRVIARIGQRSPMSSSRKKSLRVVGTNQEITDRDFEVIGIPARQHLNQRRASYKRAFVVLIDDLEAARKVQERQVFARYREALDRALGERKHLAAVHFLVNMLEAYYFADAAAINAVLGTQLADYPGDVEEIEHPKNTLKAEARAIERSFDEVEDGAQIIQRLKLPHVLSRPGTCASLRALFGWCAKAARLEEELADALCLSSGVYSAITGPQIGAL
ncbi:uncharacterized protein SOCE26_098720 [Sorangium cellulosum]|uniref:Uncharacterized protein n=1 Tax=Sorangium cellulosum TaxID=56 RepID=A0A2L0F9S4_SORCE|nr:DUF4276 family protein [Sorangium cellulosum]AUX48338.1 uncharacterized protein SOCE26_098720 [Sorangium cellulosum]